MKIYIAGPMKGKKDKNIPEFLAAQEMLESLAFIVLNPAILPEREEITKEQYMDIDLAMIRACDHIYMLKGWQDSSGAFLEHAYAKYLGLEIVYQEEPK